jgi:flagellar biosynthesis protein FlhB
MADKPDKSQKTEKPTPQRKKQARQEGQIPKSPDIAGWVIVLGSTFLVPNAAAGVLSAMDAVVIRLHNMGPMPEPRAAVEALGVGLSGSLLAIAPLLGFVALLGLVSTLAQVGFIVTGKALKPKKERVSPIAGFKRLFSTKSLWETAKALAKFLVIAAVATPAVLGLANELMRGSKIELSVMLPYVGEQVIALVRLIASIAMIIAFADYAYQRRQSTKQMMMTKHELKREMKNTEGDPMVKGKIRALMRAASQNRMMAAVGDANVVIMNPTHVAVALRYRALEGAPRVVAKGLDSTALRIRERAREHGVPIIEAPPLARAIYKACDLDEEIPFRLFDAVAKVLAFVHRLGGRTSLSGSFVLNDIQVDDEGGHLAPRGRRRRAGAR